ncbi:hypothetical protein OAB00_00165 [Akkermansiaceae bacterium]|nr:hypothetical protein [Akkermansiaceae bacterium]
MNKGKNVPDIYITRRRMANLVVFLKRKRTPMSTSQYPMILTQTDGSKNGMKDTVSRTSESAADRFKGFNIPNQMNTMAKDILIPVLLKERIFSDIFTSRSFHLNIKLKRLID